MTGPGGAAGRRRRLLLAAFLAALALTVFFGVRAVLFAVYWHDPAHRDEAIAGWMTPRYVAHSWNVPPEVVAAAIDLEPGAAGRRPTLERIAAAEGVPLPELTARIETAIARYRETDE